MPFKASSNSELYQQIENSPNVLGRELKLTEWRHVSESARDLVTKLLCPDPAKRLSADEALQHPWVVLRGQSVTGSAHDLHAAHQLLKRQVRPRLSLL